MPDLIIVKPTVAPNADGSGRVVLFERDPDHPNGEAFVAIGVDGSGKQPVFQVAKTQSVERLIVDGALTEIAASRKKE
jgi:hypothetical protein